MATEVVSIPAKYRSNIAGVINEHTGGSDLFLLQRPDRVRTRKPTGWLYPKPYEMRTIKHRVVSGTIRSENQSSGAQYSYEGFLGSFVDGGSSVDLLSSSTTERNQSIMKALTNLKDQRVNLGVALAEAQQTADFVGSSALKLGRAAKHALDGDFKRALGGLGVKRWRDYPSGWLGYNYAALPLLGDIYGSLSALNERRDLTEWVITVKGVSNYREMSADVFQSQPNMFGGCYRIDNKRRGYFTRLDYYPGNTFLSTLSSAGVTNPLEVIWEKVPFSFVVDWMVPVGDWLSTMDAALGFKFLSGSTTMRLESTRSTVVANEPVNPPYRCKFAKFEGKQRTLHIIRTVHNSSPLVAAPRIKNPLSLGHMANGLSLLAAVFGGRR